MKKLLFLLCALFSLSFLSCSASKPEKRLYMWFDCEANYARLSYPDSITYYLNKVKQIGFTDVVVDMKSIMGEVLYDSQVAPYMGDWEGVERSRSYDMMEIFIREGHKLGLGVHASLNIFAGGHNYFDRGLIYTERPEWQSQVYWQGKIIPISDMKWNYNGMLNPANPEVRQYQLDVIREFVTKYPATDGFIIDRGRFDNITSDFSPLSRELFEQYSGIELENYPDDILYWVQNKAGRWEWRRGKHFNKWLEWRAMVIRDFFEDSRTLIKSITPDMLFGTYTGAWYPTYYQLGVNWASKDYDPSLEFDWATPEYKNTGYAELLDYYMTGLYYTLVTKEEVDDANIAAGARTEPGMDNSRNYWYCVEGGAELAKEITRGVVPVIGSLYVEQYDGDADRFARAVTQSIDSSDGMMLFDIVHIINRNWWEVLHRGIENAQK